MSRNMSGAVDSGSGVKLTPRTALKVRSIRHYHGSKTVVELRAGMRVVVTEVPINRDRDPVQYEYEQNTLDWRRPQFLTGDAPVARNAARFYGGRACHALSISRVNGKRATDAQIEAIINVANIGLCFCADCRECLDPEDESNDDPDFKSVLRCFPCGKTQRISTVTYMLYWHVAVANQLVKHDNEAGQLDVVTDPRWPGRTEPFDSAAVDAILAESSQP